MPGWSARTLHVPAFRSVTVAPFVPPVLHTAGVVLVNVTARCDDAVAATVIGAWGRVTPAGAANVIVCASFVTAKLRAADGAAL